MPYSRFRDLSDEDLASVIVYVRSMPPVHVQRPKSIIPANSGRASTRIQCQVPLPLRISLNVPITENIS